MARDYQSAYDKNEDHDVYYRTRKSIQKIRANAVAAHLNVAAHIKELVVAEGFAKARLFAEQCGMTEKEFGFYAEFPDEKSDIWSTVSGQWIGAEALELLLNSDSSVLRQGLTALKMRTSLTVDQLERIRRVTSEASLGKDEIKSRFRQKCFAHAGSAVGSDEIIAFENAAGLLYALMRDYQDGLDLIDEHDRDWQVECELYPDDPEIELQAEAWKLYKQHLNKLLQTTRDHIIQHSVSVLTAFSKLFPDAHVAIEDWISVGEKDLAKVKLAESRFALDALSKGHFDSRLPEIVSRYHSWSSLSSIGFLAGETSAFHLPASTVPRPLVKLKALVINEASGSVALGISASNYIVAVGGCVGPLSVETIQSNRMDWRTDVLKLDSPDLLQAAFGSPYRPASQTLDILASTITGEPGKRGNGLSVTQTYERNLSLIKEAKPKGFYIEGSQEILDLRHTSFLQSLREELRQLGYVTVVMHMNAADFGVPQNRPRMVLLGVEPKYAGNLRLPILRQPILTNVGRSVADLAFPFLFHPLSETLSKEVQVQYSQWAKKWTEDGPGSFPATQDLLTLVYGTNERSKWTTKFGFSPNTFDHARPGENKSLRAFVPLTIPILKRLQGLPDDWTVCGDNDEQLIQIVHSTPPVVARILAETLHQAITGETVDLDLVAREVILARHTKRPTHFRIGYAAQRDPRKFAEAEWRNYVRQRGDIVGYSHSHWDETS